MRLTSGRGFTLLEVMVALAVLALALTAALHTLHRQTGQTHYLQQRLMAQWVAANEIARVRLLHRAGASVAATDSGEARMGLQTWRWQRRSESVADGDMRRITVTVADADGEDRATLSALLEDGP